MFTKEEREQIRGALVSAAQEDPEVTGAAHLGSAAADRLDDWSDIDLALCISPEGELQEVISAWTSRLYRDHGAVAHCDVRRGETLYRVFLLHNTLQVDISFWPAEDSRCVWLQRECMCFRSFGRDISTLFDLRDSLVLQAMIAARFASQ